MRKIPVKGCNVFVVLLLLSLDPEVMTDSNCYMVSNGCSIPGNLPFFYKKFFRSACVKHDVCYDCGQHWGWRRSHCDSTFKQDMYRLCGNKFGRRKRRLFSKVKRCKTFAGLYYGSVLVAGKWYWSKVSPDWCKNPCTESRGDPSTSLQIKG